MRWGYRRPDVPRLLVLIPLLAWLFHGDPAPVGPTWLAALLVFGGCALIPLIALASNVVALRRLSAGRAPPRWARLARSATLPMLLGWYGACLWSGGWPGAVVDLVGRSDGTAGLLLGTLPAYVGWAILLAADFPAARRRRELRRRHDDLMGRPITPPLRLGPWWLSGLRTQLLLTLAPLVAFWLVRDIAEVLLNKSADAANVRVTADVAALVLTGAGLIAALTAAPLLVSRILPTRPISGEGADRLHDLVDRSGLRDSGRKLLRAWHTENAVANALAVGVLPRLRYVLLSDLLLRALPPWQLEAVLAHELGHLRHRHVVWFVLFFAACGLGLIGPIDRLYGAVVPTDLPAWVDDATSLGLLGVVLAGFLLLSRLFERQADVFAAKLIEPEQGGVGPTGAWAFGQALHSAVGLNGGGDPGVSVGGSWVARLWRSRGRLAHVLHGSPERRVGYLAWLAEDPRRTRRFDRRVVVIKSGIALLGLLSLAWLAL